MECTLGGFVVDARVQLSKYSNQVLAVVKAKHGLKDKSAALNKFIETYGENEVEPEVKEEYIKKLLEIENKHFKKYGYGHTTIKELKREIEGE